MNAFDEIRFRLKSRLTADDYHRWIEPLAWGYDQAENKLVISVPTFFHQKKIANDYIRLILEEAAFCGLSYLRYEIKCYRQLPFGGNFPPINLSLALGPAPCGSRLRIDPEHSFESFIVYPSNRLAAQTLELFTSYDNSPGKLIFISSSGPWGKSHLLDAAAGLVSKEEKVWKLGAEDSDERLWETAEVIIVDDVHSLEGRPVVQNRLIRALDEIPARRLRVVASGLTSPLKIQSISEQLRSRMAGGIQIKIDPPEFELMMDLSGRKTRKAGLEINQEKRSALAKAAQGDPRRLMGFLESAGYIASKTDLSLQEALDRIIQDKSPDEAAAVPTVQFILETVASSFALKTIDLTGHTKLRQTAWPRRVAMYLTREMTGLTTSEIGKAFGGRDHSTVIHALKKINEEVKNSAQARTVENTRRVILMGAKETPQN